MKLVQQIAFALLVVLLAFMQTNQTKVRTRLQVLEDKEAIRALIVDYGRYVDDRNWDAFANLFASDGGTWNGGMGIATGRDAIRKMMVDTIAADNKNAAGTGMSNVHLLSNESISVSGDSATALSKWVFVMTGEDKGPDPTFVGRYQDSFIRENGEWKFKERIVHGDISKPVNLPGLNNN